MCPLTELAIRELTAGGVFDTLDSGTLTSESGNIKMTMPIDLVLVRHGESEGNVAVKASKKMNDDSHYTPEFLSRHSSSWRLTERGREQAIEAGAWLRQHFPQFQRYYVSEYARALETAGLLGLEDAEWYRELYLRERDRGLFDVIPYSVLKEQFAEDLRRWSGSALFAAPPGGESMADVCMRVDRILHTLHRECTEKSVIIVCHGEVMWAFRLRIERMSQERYIELNMSDKAIDRINNCQIIHYTRRNPERNELSGHMDWMRMIRADDPTFPQEWKGIIRARFSNEELLAAAEAQKRTAK